MSTTLSRWNLPSNVSVREHALTGDLEIIICGRDKVRQFTLKGVLWVTQHGPWHVNDFVEMHLRQLQEREAELDAVTAKLTAGFAEPPK